MNNKYFIPPVSYQGNKKIIASQIVSKILEYSNDNTSFYDVCCGSGAVSIELIKQNIAPNRITMIDVGPWGLFWKLIGENLFDLNILNKYIKNIPQNPNLVKKYIEQLTNLPSNIDTVYKFLLIQACNFAGKSIRLENNTWKNVSIKPVWNPSNSSVRKHSSGTFTVSPKTLVKRLTEIIKRCKNINGIYDNAINIIPSNNSIIYIDPQYKKSYGYGKYKLDVEEFLENTHSICLISETYQLEHYNNYINSFKLNYNPTNTSINAKKKSKQREEWLSVIDNRIINNS